MTRPLQVGPDALHNQTVAGRCLWDPVDNRCLWDPAVSRRCWPRVCDKIPAEGSTGCRSGEQQSAERATGLEADTRRGRRRPLLVTRSRERAAERAASRSPSSPAAGRLLWRARPSAAARGDVCGGVEIPIGCGRPPIELHVFFELPRHLADRDSGGHGDAGVALSAVQGGGCSEHFGDTEEPKSTVLCVQEQGGKNRGNLTLFVVGIIEQYG